MTLPPFDFKHNREDYPNDGSTTTTVRLTAFYRVIEISYNRPLRRDHKRKADQP